MQNFSPFPLRARGAFEIFDAAIKLYKQYFWVLVGWSAIVTSASLFGSILPMGGFAGFFLSPLSIGAVICCVAASVRGQSVEFGQCWRFTQPRYWMMLGIHLLGSLIGFLLLGITTAIGFGVVFAGIYAFQSSPFSVQLVMGILASVILGVLATIVWTVIFSWVSLVPIVICMEEDKRSSAALGRAYDILRGHWVRITGLMALVGMGMFVILLIMLGVVAMIGGVGGFTDLLKGNGEGTVAILLAALALGLGWTMLIIFCTPLYYLILTVFYLDVRVRQEALDLEWTAHASMPEAPQDGIAATPGFIPTETATGYPTANYPTNYSASELSPSSLSSPPQPPLQTAATPDAGLYGTRPLNEEPNPFSPAALELKPIVPAESPFATSTEPSFTTPLPSTPETPGEPTTENPADHPDSSAQPTNPPRSVW